MKHAGPATLERIGPLLRKLRSRPALREARPGVFSLKSRAFLHFHDDPSGIYADVRFSAEFVRLRVTTRSEQADLLDRIDCCLSAVETRVAGRQRQRRRRPRKRSGTA